MSSDKLRRTLYKLHYDVTMSNPNGDPDNGNSPRVDLDGFGLQSPVSLKRGVRDSVLVRQEGEAGMGIFVQERRPLNEASNIATKETGKDLSDAVLAYYYDVRAFGAVMSAASDDNKAAAITGPVVFGWGKSLDPIPVTEHAILRCCPANDKKGDHNMGSVHVVSYARYEAPVFVSHSQAEKTGFSERDLEVLEDGIIHGFQTRRSQARPQIEVEALYRIDVTPECKATDSQLLSVISCRRKAGVERPRSSDDYETSLEELPDGATLTVLTGQ